MSSTVKPLIIIDTGIIGGPGRGIFQLASHLKRKSIDFDICNFHYQKEKCTEFVKEATGRGIEVKFISQRFKFDFLPLWQAYKIAKEGAHTLVQSHGYKSHIIAAFVSLSLKIPWVAFAHGWTAENLKVRIYHALDRILLRYPEVVIAVSRQLHEVLGAPRRARKTELLLNAVEPQLIRVEKGGERWKSELKLPEDATVLACVGRLSFEKGQDILLKALAKVLPVNSSVLLLLVGDGPLKKDLTTLANTLGISDHVRFIPHCNAIGDVYQAIDLLVLPSRSEGLPNVVLEAMSFAVPVAASAVGAVPEVISNGVNGWLLKPDSDSIGQSLEGILRDPQKLKEMGRQGQISLLPRFCPEQRSERIVGIYRSLLKS